MNTQSHAKHPSEKMESLIGQLRKEPVSCVIYAQGATQLFRERGVKDLFRLLKEEPEWLRGALVADKVVGKGAAALMVLGGVEELYSEVISRPALELLERHQVRVSFTTLVEQISNRTQTGPCPIESRCSGCQTPEACLRKIEEFILS